MRMPDPKQVREALDREREHLRRTHKRWNDPATFDAWWEGQHMRQPEPAAARAYATLAERFPWLTEPWEKCEECGFHTAGTQPTGDSLPSSSWVSCRSCVGGLVPPEGLVKAVVGALRGWPSAQTPEEIARRVLAALTEGGK